VPKNQLEWLNLRQSKTLSPVNYQTPSGQTPCRR